MSREQMLAGMHELEDMKAAAKTAGREWAYAAVSKQGQAILIYATGEIEGFETGVIVNRIPMIQRQAWSEGFATAQLGQVADMNMPASSGAAAG